MTDRGHTDRLTESVRAIARRRAPRPVAPPPGELPPGDLPARVAALEREVKEIRTRINALFFTVLTVVLVDVLGRAVLS